MNKGNTLYKFMRNLQNKFFFTILRNNIFKEITNIKNFPGDNYFYRKFESVYVISCKANLM